MEIKDCAALIVQFNNEAILAMDDAETGNDEFKGAVNSYWLGLIDIWVTGDAAGAKSNFEDAQSNASEGYVDWGNAGSHTITMAQKVNSLKQKLDSALN